MATTEQLDRRARSRRARDRRTLYAAGLAPDVVNRTIAGSVSIVAGRLYWRELCADPECPLYEHTQWMLLSREQVDAIRHDCPGLADCTDHPRPHALCATSRGLGGFYLYTPGGRGARPGIDPDFIEWCPTVPAAVARLTSYARTGR